MKNTKFKNIKNLPFSLLLSILLLICCKTVHLAENSKKYQIKSSVYHETKFVGSLNKLNSYHTNKFTVKDVNSDSLLEVVSYIGDKKKYIIVRTQDNRVIKEIPLKSEIKGEFKLLDIDNDSIDELIFLTLVKNKLVLNIYNLFNVKSDLVILPIDMNTDTQDNWDVNLNDVKILNHSNKNNLLILSLSTGFAKKPRGIYALNLLTSTFNWTHKTASRPINDILVYDVIGDDRQEILFSTFSSSNGENNSNGSDSLSYFMILDENGHEIHQEVIGERFTYSFFNYYPDKNIFFIYGYTKNAFLEQPKAAIISVKQNDSLYVEKSTSKKQLGYYNGPYNSLRNSTQSICYSKPNSYELLIYNNNLNEIKRIKFPEVIENKISGDFNGDGQTEFLVILKSFPSSMLKGIILDNEFNILAKQNFSTTSTSIPINIVDDDVSSFFFLDYDAKRIVKWTIPIENLEANFGFNFYLERFLSFLPWIVSTFLAAFILIIYLYYHKRRSTKLSKLDVLNEFLMNDKTQAVLILNENKEIEAVNSKFWDLFEIESFDCLNNNVVDFFNQIGIDNKIIELINILIKENQNTFAKSQELDIYVKQIIKKVKFDFQNISIGNSTKLILVKITDLTELTRNDRINNWASMAQKLAHEIKNPLMSMGLSLGRLEKKLSTKDKLSIDKYISYIKEDIERMRDSANNFMRFTTSLDFEYKKVDVSKLINNIVILYEQLHNERIEFKIECNAKSSNCFIDKDQTIQAIKNVIDNAIDAIADKGNILIRTSNLEKIDTDNSKILDYLQIEIIDNGSGISKEKIASVFEPNFTTKATGSGFGMAIVKHIIEEQKGSINISSKEDVGTNITIILPLIDN